MRAGDWKLIEFFEDGRLELYNLADDIGEERNLAGAEPEIDAATCMDCLCAGASRWRRGFRQVNPEYGAARSEPKDGLGYKSSGDGAGWVSP